MLKILFGFTRDTNSCTHRQCIISSTSLTPVHNSCIIPSIYPLYTMSLTSSTSVGDILIPYRVESWSNPARLRSKSRVRGIWTVSFESAGGSETILRPITSSKISKSCFFSPRLHFQEGLPHSLVQKGMNIRRKRGRRYCKGLIGQPGEVEMRMCLLFTVCT